MKQPAPLVSLFLVAGVTSAKLACAVLLLNFQNDQTHASFVEHTQRASSRF